MQLNESGNTHNANMTTNLKEAFSAATYHTSLFTLLTTLHLILSPQTPNLFSILTLFEEKIKTIRRAFPYVPPLHLTTFYLFPSFLSFHYRRTVHIPKISLSHPLGPISFHILKDMTPTSVASIPSNIISLPQNWGI